MIDTAPEKAGSNRDSPVDSDVAATGWFSVRSSEMSSLRSQIVTAFPDTLSLGVLKQADEQTLTALLALRKSIDDAHLTPKEIEHWGLIASARNPGRKRIGEYLVKFREHGAWSTSPHLIPHCSLHSQSGLLSQALQLHGPNFGAGGMPGAESEAIWSALALLHGDRVPGVWVVFTAWEREVTGADDNHCQAVVLGLVRSAGQMGRDGLKVSLRSSDGPLLSLESISEAIRERRPGVWSLGGATCMLALGETRMEAAA